MSTNHSRALSRRSFIQSGAAAAGILLTSGRWGPALATLRGIDHIVIMFPDLDTAIRSYTELGFTVVPGGAHPVGTHNALIAFADSSYIELIAFKTPNDKHRWWAPKEKGGGLIDFCMQTDSLAADIAAFRRAGAEIADPTPGSRVRPDGVKLAWVTAVPTGRYMFQAPFLIQDQTPREERVPRQTAHGNGVTGIGTMTVAVSDVPSVRQWYAGALGQPGQAIERGELDAAGVRFTIGPHAFDFVAPKGPTGPLVDWLKTRGPSPYAATFKTTSEKKGPLDERKAGARLSLI